MTDEEIDRRIEELIKMKSSLIETYRMYQDIMYMSSLDEPDEHSEYEFSPIELAKLLFYVSVMILAFMR